MRKGLATFISSLFVLGLVISAPLTGHSQNREKFVISARAGGVNAVTGRALRAHGTSDWQLLSIKEDIQDGDVVQTGSDGRVEMLLNPGSYLRVGENSEFELSDSSLERLEVRLIKGTAILEVTGADDTELLINVTTPHTRMAIVRRGLYRVNVVPGDTTELIVRKGRVMVDSNTRVNGGNKMIFSNGPATVAKLTDIEKNKLDKADKESKDSLEAWSKDRGKALARANRDLSNKTLSMLRTSFLSRAFEAQYGGRGFWFYHPSLRCYTFLPFFGYGWGSPYGGNYSSFYWGPNYGYGNGYGDIYNRWPSSGSGNSSSAAGSSGGGSAAPSSPMRGSFPSDAGRPSRGELKRP